jgi:antitoxin ParD1/3/4
MDMSVTLYVEVPPMNVNLGQTFEDYVRAQLETGRYNNASEVIREALRLKMQLDEERAARLQALRSDITQAREQVRRGETVETSASAFLKRRGRKRG